MIKKNFYLEYKKNGYFKIDNFFDSKLINNLNIDITKIVKKRPNKIYFYKDRKNLLRRMEHFYDYTKLLKKLNNKILILLKKIFKKEFYLFKDKYNFKPPNGEGFYAHYDGIFQWKDKNGLMRNGWHEYADEFINVLVLLDDFNNNNGPLEISKIQKGNFQKLLKNTKQNGTPDIKKSLVKKLKFKKMTGTAGCIVVFDSKCPHKSGKNNSNHNRGSLYYTYNSIEFGDNYNSYFQDKFQSQNKKSKSLTGELV